MTVLRGPLADRDAWSAVGECPIEKTMGLLGTKSAMLIMREAYYGTTRFEDFWRRVDDGFRSLASAFPERIVTVDGSRSPDEIAEEVREHVRALL